MIARPLTNLLKKEGFLRIDSATVAFNLFKIALTIAPVLALPDFTQPFVVETDASNQGIGAVLMQNHHPIAYIGKRLSLKHKAYSVYEKELLAILFAVKKKMETIRPTCSFYHQNRPEEFEVPFRIKGFCFDATYGCLSL